MRVRPPKDRGRQEVVPQDHPAFDVEYPEWVDVPRPLALQLHDQGWELESVRKAAKTRAQREETAQEPEPAADEAAPSGEES